MTIAAAHQVSAYSDAVLATAAGEAALRGEPLTVLHVVTASDLDSEQVLQSGISDLVDKAIATAGVGKVDYSVEIVAGTSTGIDDVSGAVLAAAKRANASMLVIGARRRTPVGKAFLGSITQELLLDADVPVLVVKAPQHGKS